MLTRTILCALILQGATLSAQQSPLVGVWSVNYAAGARVENGEVTRIMGTGTLTIEAQGDSLIGTLATDATPDLPARPPARLAAKTGSPDAVFESRSEATLNMNGSERKATVINTWRLTARSDSLSGTLERQLVGFEMGNQGPAPVTGLRRKG